MKVTLYTKTDCSLCDEAKDVIASVRAQVPFELETVDITADAALFERFRHDIPVIFVDGHKAFKHRLDADSFLRRLAQ